LNDKKEQDQAYNEIHSYKAFDWARRLAGV
jgi:hypothetical protein